VFIGAASAQLHSPVDPVTYATDLECGGCILGGYNFCMKALDAFQITTTEPEMKCCRDATCAEASNKQWSCSSAYKDQSYSLEMCPFNTNHCGAKAIPFATQGSSDVTIEISEMDRGETCCYSIETECGAPGFEGLDGNAGADELVFDFHMIKEFQFLASDTSRSSAKSQTLASLIDSTVGLFDGSTTTGPTTNPFAGLSDIFGGSGSTTDPFAGISNILGGSGSTTDPFAGISSALGSIGDFSSIIGGITDSFLGGTSLNVNEILDDVLGSGFESFTASSLIDLIPAAELTPEVRTLLESLFASGRDFGIDDVLDVLGENSPVSTLANGDSFSAASILKDLREVFPYKVSTDDINTAISQFEESLGRIPSIDEIASQIENINQVLKTKLKPIIKEVTDLTTDIEVRLTSPPQIGFPPRNFQAAADPLATTSDMVSARQVGITVSAAFGQ